MCDITYQVKTSDLFNHNTVWLLHYNQFLSVIYGTMVIYKQKLILLSRNQLINSNIFKYVSWNYYKE